MIPVDESATNGDPHISEADIEDMRQQVMRDHARGADPSVLGDNSDTIRALRQAAGIDDADDVEVESLPPLTIAERVTFIASTLFTAARSALTSARKAISGTLELNIGGLCLKGELESLKPKLITTIAPKRTRKFPIAFGPVDVPPNTTITVQIQPQILFRGQKIINTGDDELFVQGLFVGNKPQLPTFSSAISIKTWGAQVTDNEIQMDTCDPALFITFQIQNPTSSSRKFSATIIGDALQ